jgi:hypothetical protein
MVTVAAYGAGMVLGAGAAVGVELAGPAVLAGGARLAAAYQEAGIAIAVNFPRATALVTAVAAGMAGVSLPSSSAGPVAQQATRSVWSLGPFLRGRIIERILGQRLPGQFMTASNFPVIDKVVAGPGNIASQVISIKSLDLGAASYAGGNAVFNRLVQYIGSLANFTGATRSGQIVLTNAGTQRVLELAIPATGASASQLQQLSAAAVEAARQGITLNVRVFR